MTTRGVGLSEEEREARTVFAMFYQGWDPDDPDSADGLATCRSVVRTIVAARTADLAAQVARVKALADRWAREAVDRGPFDEVYTDGVVAMLRAALSPAQPDTERGGGS